MKILGSKWYLLVLVILIAVVTWRIVDTKLTVYSPEYVSLALIAPAERALWEASDSATLAQSKERLLSQVTAQSFMVFDVSSHTILAEKNATQILPPASTTKLMTALTALELFDLNDVVEVSTQAALENDGGGLFPHEKIRVRDLLIGLIVSSANDSAFALAEHARNGIEDFLTAMNQYAQRLQLQHTFYGNPAGYDVPPNATSAQDLTILTLSAMQNPALFEWMSSPNSVVYSTDGMIQHFLFTTNELLGVEPGIVAGKTGTTELAKEVLVSVAEYEGRTVIITVMGSADRYTDTRLLWRWVRDNIRWETSEQLTPLDTPLQREKTLE